MRPLPRESPQSHASASETSYRTTSVVPSNSPQFVQMHSLSVMLPVEITAVHERRTWGEFITRLSSVPPLSTTRTYCFPRRGIPLFLSSHVAAREASSHRYDVIVSRCPQALGAVSTGRAPFPGLFGDAGGMETERTLTGKATADASRISLSLQIQMLALSAEVAVVGSCDSWEF
ncbi:hypothetical protein MUK42_33659 [Musa troglodytarum]|uniref:Uncharacterized protein n=1 Tax=Musa troglodytarum TaxID=320322 RepID=A0A9E7I3U7_9LILI|nr:hypothetical protein MUK42_33659 [Musa troglodytarum]